VPADNKKNSEARNDVLAALDTMERCLQGSCNQQRRLLAKLALVTTNQLKIFQNEDLIHLKSLLSNLDSVCELQEGVRVAADCSFLYWHRVVLPIYFGKLLEERADLKRLKVIYFKYEIMVLALKINFLTVPKSHKFNLFNTFRNF